MFLIDVFHFPSQSPMQLYVPIPTYDTKQRVLEYQTLNSHVHNALKQKHMPGKNDVNALF